MGRQLQVERTMDEALFYLLKCIVNSESVSPSFMGGLHQMIGSYYLTCQKSKGYLPFV